MSDSNPGSRQFLPQDPQMASAPELPPIIARDIGGFVIERALGRGGMGQVFRAWQRSLNRRVAVKLLAPEAVTDPKDVERFVREARAAAAVTHPNVVAVIQAGVDPVTGMPFIVYELVEGEDLESIARRTGPLPERRVLEIGRDVCRGLGAAHDRGIIHRDVKPANILITHDGRAKLADLGLAKREHDGSLTRTGEIVGTPDYVSPEQALDQPLDVRTDIYSLGLVLFRVATGRSAFASSSAMGTMTMRLTEACPDPRALAPALSPGFAALIARLAAREREGAPATPGEAAAMIDAVLGGQPISAFGAALGAVAAPGGPAKATSGTRRAARSSRRGPLGRTSPARRASGPPVGLIVAGATLGVAVAIGLVVMAVASSKPDPRPAAGAPGERPSEPAGGAEAPAPAEIAKEPPPVAPEPLPRAPVGPRDPFASVRRTARTRLVHVFGQHEWRHPSLIMRVGVGGADGRRIVSLGLGGDLAVHELGEDGSGGGEVARWVLPPVVPTASGIEYYAAAAISPDGRWAIAGDTTGRLIVHDIEDAAAGALVVAAHEGAVYDVVVGADGRSITSVGADRIVRRSAFDPASGRVGETLLAFEAPADTREVDVSRDGGAIAVGVRSMRPEAPPFAQLWDATSAPPRLVRRFAAPAPAGVARVALSADGSRLLVTADQDPGDPHAPASAPIVYDVGAPGGVGRPLEGVHTRCRGGALSPDGRRAVTGGGLSGEMALWNADTGELVRAIEGHQSWAQDLAFAKGGALVVSVGNDGAIRRWGVETGAEVDRPKPTHLGGILAIAAARRGPLVASLGGDAVRIWDVEERVARGSPSRPPGPRALARAIGIDPDDGLVAVGDENGNVVVGAVGPDGQLAWQWQTGERRQKGCGLVTSISIGALGVVVAHDGGDCWLYQRDQKTFWRVAPLGKPIARAELVEPQGGGPRVVVVERDGTAVILDPGAGPGKVTNEGTFAASDGALVRATAASRDGTRLAVVTGDAVIVRALPGGELLGRIPVEVGRYDPALDWSSDGRWLVVAMERTVLLVDPAAEGGPSVADRFSVDTGGLYGIRGVAFARGGGGFLLACVHGTILAFEID